MKNISIHSHLFLKEFWIITSQLNTGYIIDLTKPMANTEITQKTLDSDHYKTGFSLLELAVGLLIMTTLFMIAIPSYQAFILRSHRQTGLADMLHIQLLQADYYRQQGRYAEQTELKLPENIYYTFVIERVDQKGYILKGIAKSSQERDTAEGQSCAVLTIDQLNHKQPLACW